MLWLLLLRLLFAEKLVQHREYFRLYYLIGRLLLLHELLILVVWILWLLRRGWRNILLLRVVYGNVDGTVVVERIRLALEHLRGSLRVLILLLLLWSWIATLDGPGLPG